MKRLPRSLSDLDGLRAALWVRESTAGQFDAFGPDAQRKQYATALTRRWASPTACPPPSRSEVVMVGARGLGVAPPTSPCVAAVPHDRRAAAPRERRGLVRAA